MLKSRPGADASPGVTGVARVGRDTVDLLRRLRPGDIAVIDQVDLDRWTAEQLIGAKVAAVVNVEASVSGRLPVLGAQLVVDHDIPLLDQTGADLFGGLRDGEVVRLSGNQLLAEDGRVVATGQPQSSTTVAELCATAATALRTQLSALAAETWEYVDRDTALLLDGVGIPTTRTHLEGRHVLIAAPGAACAQDLARLRRYLRRQRPVLVGVEAGADALLAQGLRPDLLVGHPNRFSEAALRCGGELLVPAPPGQANAGLVRMEQLGLPATHLPTFGTAEAAAIMLADHGRSELVVVAGGRASLPAMLAEDRTASPSVLLARLHAGDRVLDAASAARLANARPRDPVRAVLVAVLLALVVVVGFGLSPIGAHYLADVQRAWLHLLRWVHGQI